MRSAVCTIIVVCFHAYKSVAPLKLAGVYSEGMRRFHAYKSVATLKGRIMMRPCIVMRPAPIAVMHPAPTFSRLQKRGPTAGVHRDAPSPAS